jgi:hypothetical protein
VAMPMWHAGLRAIMFACNLSMWLSGFIHFAWWVVVLPYAGACVISISMGHNSLHGNEDGVRTTCYGNTMAHVMRTTPASGQT